MADLIVRWDESTGYGYLTSGDGYAIPAAVWAELSDKRGTYRAEYSNDHRGELRIPGPRVLEAVTYLEAEGHRVQRTTGTRAELPTTRHHTRQECTTCGQDYPPGYRPAAGETCAAARTVYRTQPDGTRQAEPEHAPHPLTLRDCRAP